MEMKLSMSEIILNDLTERNIRKRLWEPVFTNYCLENNIDTEQFDDLMEMPDNLKGIIEDRISERLLKAEIIINL